MSNTDDVHLSGTNRFSIIWRRLRNGEGSQSVVGNGSGVVEEQDEGGSRILDDERDRALASVSALAYGSHPPPPLTSSYDPPHYFNYDLTRVSGPIPDFVVNSESNLILDERRHLSKRAQVSRASARPDQTICTTAKCSESPLSKHCSCHNRARVMDGTNYVSSHNDSMKYEEIDSMTKLAKPWVDSSEINKKKGSFTPSFINIILYRTAHPNDRMIYCCGALKTNFTSKIAISAAINLTTPHSSRRRGGAGTCAAAPARGVAVCACPYIFVALMRIDAKIFANTRADAANGLLFLQKQHSRK
ncbi:hypothetical protein EVAR_60462_1 [Eumeta japonica]|uniref:Uncharacterized protein n=1 Tax=Eumeta variegata TaxID=151549 RepID=A0A4C1Z4E4_EUMVA|nr:hypothetical protein EVAR_60462_1 [Eumeta japonica]